MKLFKKSGEEKLKRISRTKVVWMGQGYRKVIDRCEQGTAFF